MLEVSGVSAGYGGNAVLHRVSLQVTRGEMVTLIGPNGAGKSTLLNCISGFVPPTEGTIKLNGQPISTLAPFRLSRIGLLHVPEGRQILPELSVRDNLLLGTTALFGRPPTHTLGDVHALFPILLERDQQQAGSLSGGQQQMLAIGRALMGAPSLLLLDEPSLGLSPMLSQQVLRALGKLNGQGLTILLVEQNARAALKVTHRAYVLEQGRIVHEGDSRRLREDPLVLAHYLGQAKANAQSVHAP